MARVKSFLQKKGFQKKPIVDDDGKLYGRARTTPESKDPNAPKSRQTKQEVKADTEIKATRAKGKDVKQEIKKDAKRRGDKSVKQERDTRPKRDTFSKLDQKEMAYDDLQIGVRRKLISKQKKGEPATYQGTDYSDVLSTRKGIKPQVTKKQTGGTLNKPADKDKTLKKKPERKPAKGITIKTKRNRTSAKGLRGMGVALRGGGKVSRR